MAQSTPGPSRKRSSYFTPPPPSSAQSGPFHSPLSPVQPLSSPLAAFLGSASFPPSVPFSSVPRVRRRPVKKKRFNTRLLYSILYQTSFYFFIVVIAALLVGSVWGLGDQAWKTADARRWNIVILVAAYLALVSWRPLSNQTVPSCRFRRFPVTSYHHVLTCPGDHLDHTSLESRTVDQEDLTDHAQAVPAFQADRCSNGELIFELASSHLIFLYHL